MVRLKYLRNFAEFLKFLESTVKSVNYVIVSTAVANQGATLAMTGTKIYLSFNRGFIKSRQCKTIRSIKLGFKARRLYPICQAKRQNNVFGSNHP